MPYPPVNDRPPPAPSAPPWPSRHTSPPRSRPSSTDRAEPVHTVIDMPLPSSPSATYLAQPRPSVSDEPSPATPASHRRTSSDLSCPSSTYLAYSYRQRLAESRRFNPPRHRRAMPPLTDKPCLPAPTIRAVPFHTVIDSPGLFFPTLPVTDNPHQSQPSSTTRTEPHRLRQTEPCLPCPKPSPTDRATPVPADTPDQSSTRRPDTPDHTVIDDPHPTFTTCPTTPSHAGVTIRSRSLHAVSDEPRLPNPNRLRQPTPGHNAP